VKRDTRELGALTSRYERKLKLLHENQEIASEEWTGLREHWKTAEKDLKSDRNERNTTLKATISSLKASNSQLEARWELLTTMESIKRERFLAIQQVRSTLQQQKSQRIQLLMAIALQEILKRQLALKWKRIAAIFGTSELAAVLDKASNLQFRNESLKSNANEIMRFNAGLRNKNLQLIKEVQSMRNREDEELLRPENGPKEFEGRVSLDRKERFGKVIVASLRRTLVSVLERDTNHALLPGSIKVADLSLPQLFLVYAKSISTALEIAKQTPPFLSSQRRSTLFAMQILHRSTASKPKTTLQHRPMHLLPRKPDKMRVEFGDLSLFATASHYEQTAITSARSMPMLSHRVEEDRNTIMESEELDQLRALRKAYKQDKWVGVHSSPSAHVVNPTSKRDLLGKKLEKAAKLERDLVELDRERQRLMKRNKDVQLEGSLSFRELRKGIGSWRVGIKRVQIARTAESSPVHRNRPLLQSSHSKPRLQLPPSQPHSSTASTLPSPGLRRPAYPSFPSFQPV